ncbi:MAG: AMP-binding protein [Sphingomonadales bacterium]|jgi:D-alanine--poly(phosphoribitol) ligase subunit 1
MSISFLQTIFKRLQTGGLQTACVIEDTEISYSSFSAMTGAVQAKIQRTGSMRIGIITQNAAETYATIIAAWLTGKAYIPIPAHYPLDRIAEIISSAEISAIFYATEDPEVERLTAHFPKIIFINTSDLPAADCFYSFPAEDKEAYLLFTSGTTGKPKGVPVTFGNIQAFMDGFDALGYQVHEDDRFLQMFELTFDLSVVCFTLPLICGGSFHTLPSGMIKTLALYHVLEENRITFSLMVPSAIGLLLPYLDDIHLPELRVSQFCGEALKKDLLEKWMVCVPNARIDNVYGPTEATIYCSALTCASGKIPNQSGVVGIGKPMQESLFMLLDEHGNEITDTKMEGELCLGGMQLTPGYLNNPEQNGQKFFHHHGIRYYRTGDIAYRDRSGNYFYIGRKDDQVKIQGYRIELGELEVASARILPQNPAVAVGYQVSNNWYLALFVLQAGLAEQKIKEALRPLLPHYMQPHRVFAIDEIPLNANGKTDRKALRIQAERQHAS